MLRILQLSILAAISFAAFAEPPQLGGRNELSLFGGFDFSGPNGDNIDLQVGYGRYLRDDLLVVGELQWRLIEDISPGEKDYRSQQFGVALEKLFPGDGRLLPFVGAEAGIRNTRASHAVESNSVDDSGLVLGARAGLRYFLSESVSVHGSVRWLIAGDDLFVVDFEPDDQYVYPSFGIHAVF